MGIFLQKILIIVAKTQIPMMKMMLTGTACAGKSTLLDALAKKGYQTFAEAETPLVQELKDNLGPDEAKKWILENYTEFKRRVGNRQKEIYSISVDGQPAFYDRSAICYIGYCKLRNAQTPENLLELASQTNPSHVFFLDRLAHFNERKETGRFMSETEANKLADLIEYEYRLRGIELIRVPEFSPRMDSNLAKRISYIESILTN